MATASKTVVFTFKQKSMNALRETNNLDQQETLDADDESNRLATYPIRNLTVLKYSQPMKMNAVLQKKFSLLNE